MEQVRKLNIVIADDDLDDQFLLKSAIRESGVISKFYTVFNGIQLLDFLLKREAFRGVMFEPDIIFLDLNMPLMDGLTAVSEMRKLELVPKYSVYIVSTSRNPDDVRKVLSLGAAGFFNKPPTFDELKTIVKEACEKHIK